VRVTFNLRVRAFYTPSYMRVIFEPRARYVRDKFEVPASHTQDIFELHASYTGCVFKKADWFSFILPVIVGF